MKRARWMSVVAIVLAGVGGTAYLVHPAPMPAPAPASTPAPQTKETPKDEEAANLSGHVVQAANTGDSPKAKESPTVEESSAAKNSAKPGAARKSMEERRLLLPTVAALASAHCYQTYLNLGFIADGKEQQTYSEKDARKLLDSVLSTLNSIDRSMESLDKIAMDDDERDSLEQVRAAWALLRLQGKQLRVVWDGGKDRDEDLRNYETLRRNSWATISKLMGLAR